jgi:hypothetical protein
MKIFLLLFFFSISLFAQNVKVQDYQVPLSTAKDLRFNGGWNWSQLGDSVTSNNANASLLYRAFYSSLPLAWFIDVDANGFKNKEQLGHLVRFKGRLNKYIWPNEDLFAFSELNASHNEMAKQIASDLTMGFGYGRYINATALAKAVRIENHLLRDKVIKDFLPKETMIKIANIIEREGEYRTLYGEVYETYWFDDIEEEINNSGDLTGESIGSVGILRMRQVLFNINERVNPRFYGWEATLGILFPLTNADKSKAGKPNLSAGGRYSIPLNWLIQINATARIFTPIDSSFAKEYNSTLGVDFIYELSNKINFVTNYTIGSAKLESSRTTVTHFLGSSFWFYLENNIYLTINANFAKQGRGSSVLSNNIGLQYNLF